MQIIQPSASQHQQFSRLLNNKNNISQIQINKEQLALKSQIVGQLLNQPQIVNHRAILWQWPNQQLRNKLQNQQEGFQICRKKQNAKFYGQVCNQMFHGYGLLIYQYSNNNSIRFYQGDFQNNCKHGIGIQFINGDIYIGKYLNNKPQDHSAIFIWKNGDTFSGNFVNGMKHGYGRWTSGSDMYLGQWKFNKPDGQGIIKTLNSTYEGNVRNGYKHGTGAQIFSNGDRYNGNYANGKPEGQGTYYWNNGAIYKGDFKNGLRYGYGQWKYNAQRYQGYYVNDKRSGHGLYTWQGGSFYKGQFKDDLRNGFGQMHWNQLSYYIGNWRQGVQQGQGQLWQSGKMAKKGLFQNGKLIKQYSYQHQNHQSQHQNSHTNPSHNNHSYHETHTKLNPIKNTTKYHNHKSTNYSTRYPQKNQSPIQKTQEQNPAQYRQNHGVKSSFSNQTKISKHNQSQTPSRSFQKHHLNNRNVHYHNPKVSLPKNNHYQTPSQGNKSYLEKNYTSKTRINKFSQKNNKVNLSYNQQQMRRIIKPSVAAKSTAVDIFSQTHLSPIKWNNFKHMRGQQYHQNGKLPNIY